MSGSWFSVGDNVPQEARSSGGGGGKFLRMWVKKGASKMVILLEDQPFCFYEHSPKVNGKWGGYEHTCLKGIADFCPTCEADNYRYYVGMYTAITFYDKKDGTKGWQKQVVAAKTQTIDLLKHHREKYGSLKFHLFDVYRGTGKTPSVGDSWQHEKELSVEDIKKMCPGLKDEDLKPFDHATLFAPKSIDEVKALLRGEGVKGDGDDEGGKEVPYGDGQADDIPF